MTIFQRVINNWLPGSVGADGRRNGPIEPIKPTVEKVDEHVVVLERITHCAIKAIKPDSEIIVHQCEYSKTHGYLQGKYGEDLEASGYAILQGFITSTGRFVTRFEAMPIAFAAKQIRPSAINTGLLYSTELIR